MSTTTNILPTVREVSSAPRPEELRDFTRSMRAFLDRNRAEVRVTANAEGTSGANVRRFTAQVIDRAQRPITKSLWCVRLFVGTSAYGAPGGTQTYALVTGTALTTITANQVYDVLTDEYGKVVFDLTVTGAATRYVTAAVLGEVQPPTAGFTWAA